MKPQKVSQLLKTSPLGLEERSREHCLEIEAVADFLRVKNESAWRLEMGQPLDKRSHGKFRACQKLVHLALGNVAVSTA